jgi:hypothetical protein
MLNILRTELIYVWFNKNKIYLPTLKNISISLVSDDLESRNTERVVVLDELKGRGAEDREKGRYVLMSSIS